MVGLSWPALGTLGSAVANLVLLRYLLRYRGEPGARWFLGVIACQVLMSGAYGVALLVADPLWLRLALEMPVWVAINFIGVFYLGFALEYTGRVDLLWSPWFGAFVVFEVVSTAIVLTNPWHQWVWSDFHVAPVFGAATVSYTHHAWVFLQFAGLFVMTSLGVMLLLDTVISYGPLYRRQAVAIALTVVPPAAAFTAWTFELGPAPQLNLTPLMFLPHVVLDLYALFRQDMFEFSPTTRRTAERAAIDDLGTPVVILDREGRVVTLNDAAEGLFDVGKREATARDFRTLYEGDDVDPGESDQDVTVVDGGRREFTVRSTPLTDAAGTHVGYTVVFQDVTGERQRKQRLEVLNRVLRHNLRNDMLVVGGHAQSLAEELDGQHAEQADVIRRTAEELTDLGEKARLAAEAVDEDLDRRSVDVSAVLHTVAADLEERFPGGTVTVDVPDGLTVTTNPKFLELLFENLVENGLEHDDGDQPRVEVTLADVAGRGPDAAGRGLDGAEAGDDTAARASGDGAPDGLELVVRDHGPGIPDHEVAVLDSGTESALEHGSGLGLWLVNWSATIVGGEVRFADAPGGGTEARVRLPGLRAAAAD